MRADRPRLDVVAGVFAFHQTIDSDPSFKQEQGAAAARFLLAPSAAAATPGLLDGYGYDQFMNFGNASAAVFGQVSWAVTDRLRLLPGLRFNYDQKDVVFDQRVYGGLQTTDPALIALQRSILAPQSYTADVDDTNLSGNITAAYKVTDRVNAYATYSTGFKSIGLNLNGVPTDAQDRPVLSAATVRPEDERHVEFGVKTEPFRGVTANFTAFNTSIKDFQAQVVNAGVGVLRGYLANAEKVRVRGVEFDGTRASTAYHALRRGRLHRRPLHFVQGCAAAARRYGRSAGEGHLRLGAAGHLEVGGVVRRGIRAPATLLGRPGELFGAIDASYRSSFSSSATASRYLVVDGYSLLNARVGVRWTDGWTVFVWSRNLLDKNYYELLTAAPGNTGLFVGQPGDGRTVGVTLRLSLRKARP